MDPELFFNSDHPLIENNPYIFHRRKSKKIKALEDSYKDRLAIVFAHKLRKHMDGTRDWQVVAITCSFKLVQFLGYKREQLSQLFMNRLFPKMIPCYNRMS